MVGLGAKIGQYRIAVKPLVRLFVTCFNAAMKTVLNDYNRRAREKAMVRAKQIAKMKNSGKTFVQIGEHFKVSPQRAQQLYAVATALKNIE